MYRTRSFTRRLYSTHATPHTTVKIGPKEFTLPLEIKRGPTDLLKALAAATLKDRDKSTIPYGLVDDFRLKLFKYDDIQSCYLAKEYGRRTARQLATEWPTLFAWDLDEPQIEAFRPKKPLVFEEADINEESLAEMIRTKQVLDAFYMFDELDKAGKIKNFELVKKLFALCAYYNSQNVPITEVKDWNAARAFITDNAKKWEMDKAEYLFDRLVKTEETYSILIASMLKYHETAKAMKRYKEMKSLNLVPREEVFNALILNSISYEQVMKYLKDMNDWGVKPSIDTINSCLVVLERVTIKLCEQVQKSKRTKNIKCEDPEIESKLFESEGSEIDSNEVQIDDTKIDPKVARERVINRVGALVSEMKRLDLRPNLTTFHLILGALDPLSCKEVLEAEPKGVAFIQQLKAIDSLKQMLDHLESIPSIEIQSDADFQFFEKALNLAINTNNFSLVERVEKLYASRRNNIRLLPIVDPRYAKLYSTEFSFYKNFLLYWIHASDTLEGADEIYLSCVPRRFSVNTPLLITLINRIVRYQKDNRNKDGGNYWNFVKHILDSWWSFGKPIEVSDWRNNSKVRTVLRLLHTESLSDTEMEDYRRYVKRFAQIYNAQRQTKVKEYRIQLEPFMVIEIALMYFNAQLYDYGIRQMRLLTDLLVNVPYKEVNSMLSKKEVRKQMAKRHQQNLLSLVGDPPSEELMGDLLDKILAYKPANFTDIRQCMRLIHIYYPLKTEKFKLKIENAFPELPKELFHKLTSNLEKKEAD